MCKEKPVMFEGDHKTTKNPDGTAITLIEHCTSHGNTDDMISALGKGFFTSE